jgi:hypothetical protein
VTPAINANSRELRLARRALKTARTHLRNAVGLVSMPEGTRVLVRWAAIGLDDEIKKCCDFERAANAHLVAMRKRRAK